MTSQIQFGLLTTNHALPTLSFLHLGTLQLDSGARLELHPSGLTPQLEHGAITSPREKVAAWTLSYSGRSLAIHIRGFGETEHAWQAQEV